VEANKQLALVVVRKTTKPCTLIIDGDGGGSPMRREAQFSVTLSKQEKGERHTFECEEGTFEAGTIEAK
jgi:hypothetical protein